MAPTMLDVGRKFFSLSALESYVKMMSWYKMNDFHIHLPPHTKK